MKVKVQMQTCQCFLFLRKLSYFEPFLPLSATEAFFFRIRGFLPPEAKIAIFNHEFHRLYRLREEKHGRAMSLRARR